MNGENSMSSLGFFQTKLITFMLAATASFSSGIQADDTEIFFGQDTSQPNVLFILDGSISMSYSDDNGVTTRLDHLQQALNNLFQTTNDINAGILTFAGAGKNHLRQEIKPITENRDALLNVVNTLTPAGGTPTLLALLQGTQYFRGEALHTIGTTYDSPIDSACQSNHIVLLTDGEPTSFPQDEAAIANHIYGGTTNNCSPAATGTCGAELAEYLFANDHSDTVANTNNVITHTIGLSFSNAWLKTLSVGRGPEGKGQHFFAEDTAGLTEAFNSILNIAREGSNSFAAPAVTLDQFTRYSHRDDMYLALFEPSNTQRWSGNLKRYRFDGQVKDQTGAIALDTSTGTFSATSRSYWSNATDGDKVAQGGAAYQFGPEDRNVYTYLGGGDKVLTSTVNQFSENNPDITAAMLGVPDSERINLLKWARGVDVDDESENSTSRLQMGDPLHSRPVILTYGGSEAAPDSVVFVGTNEGFLHAINSADGEEVFSFIPSELLGNLNTNYRNERTINRLYGIDGDLTLWTNDADNNGQINGNDHAYLYMGMRRGGRNYYALDVTDKTAPEFLWSIQGGPGVADGGNGTAGFENLGQSWSKPTLTKISVGDVVKDVLVFGGGYNPILDHSNMRSPDSMGNDFYIVDAENGNLIWSKDTADSTLFDNSQMLYAIPSAPRIIDLNGDGLVDQIYVGDTGGQVWRLDITNNPATADELIKGGVIANLGDSSVAGNRRFFYPPDVALVESNGRQLLSVSIGSGNRPHPLGRNVENRFYMIRQKTIFQAPEGYGMIDPIASTESNTVYRPITELDLYDTTENLIGSNDVVIADNASNELESSEGWLLKMGSSGEKILATSLTVNNQISFTSYLPESVTTDVCSPAVGKGRYYSVSIFDATPTKGSEPSDRYSDLSSSGIPNEPTPFIDSEGELSILVNLEKVATPNYNEVTRVYWTEQPDY